MTFVFNFQRSVNFINFNNFKNMLYVIKAAITLALLYSCFFAFLSKETFHRFNRIMLVSIMIVSLVVPLCHFTTAHPTALNEEVYQVQTYIEHDAAPIVVTTSQGTRITWIQVLTWLYLAGVAVMLTLTLVQAVSLVRFMCGGVRHTDAQGNTVILHNCDVPPFSIFRAIVMSTKDYENSRQYILTHEQEHIRLGHTYDLLLLEAVKTLMWFNPFIWFLCRDLKAVHEYEADQAVINQGIDAKSYQQLLVMKVVGNRLQPFTNNLNHGSLKKRIFMMYQKPKTAWRMLKALCAIPVVALTINAFATPIETDPVEDMVNTLETKKVPTFNEVKEAIIVQPETTVEELMEPAAVRDTTKAEKVTPEISQPTLEHLDDNALWIIDKHVATAEEVAKLDPETVDHIEVLKDKAATDLWGSRGANGVIQITTKNAEKADDDPRAIYDKVDQMPEYPGGAEALYRFLSNNIKYPVVAHDWGVQARVIVSFIVEIDGTISDITTEKMVDPNSGQTLLEVVKVARNQEQTADEAEQAKHQAEGLKAIKAEAERVVAAMPGPWKPGEVKGKPVRVRFNLPIIFRLM